MSAGNWDTAEVTWEMWDAMYPDGPPPNVHELNEGWDEE
jgi:hypothetical protein